MESRISQSTLTCVSLMEKTGVRTHPGRVLKVEQAPSARQVERGQALAR